jgi:hypothetical protein
MKARKRRAKSITLPGGDQIPQRPSGRDRVATPQADPMETVITARQRRSGITDAKDARQPLCGDDLGLCIHASATGDARAALANTWAALSASHRNFRVMVIGQTGNPQGAAIPMIPEPMETDQSLRVDLRTHDERVAAAKASWTGWQAKINALPIPNLRWAIKGALDGFLGDGTLWRDRKPTATGVAAVSALRLLTDGK